MSLFPAVADRPVTATAPVTGRLLVCRIGAGRCALPVSNVVEVMRPMPIEPLAGVPAFIAGVAIIRGIPVPVVDTALLVRGLSERPGRLVTVRAGDRFAALGVTEVIGLRSVAPATVAALPPLLDGAGVAGGELLPVLDCARAIPPSVWDAM
jgi:purine-binding chemotaxis protein CheW